MAIKITSFSTLKPEGYKEQFSLQDNGVYWFLYPFFKNLFERTGQTIDLYGISNFRGENLLELDKTLEDAMKVTAKQPDQWEQQVGMQIKPKKQVLYDRVSRKDVLAMINSLKNITTEAIKDNAVIVFEGQ